MSKAIAWMQHVQTASAWHTGMECLNYLVTGLFVSVIGAVVILTVLYS